MKSYTARIRNVPKIGKKDLAEFQCLKNKKIGEFFDLKVSTAQTSTLLAWLQNVAHECLHMTIWMAGEVFGWDVTGQSEHKFISRIEESIAVNFHLLKERKKK